MKYLLPLLLLAAWLQAPAQFNLNNSNLVAYYPLNGNVQDYSGNGNHGTSFGNMAFVTDKWGSLNSAAGFDGINDWLLLPLTQMNKKDFTILFQFKYDSITAGPEQTIFVKTDPSFNSTLQFRLAHHNDSLQYQKGATCAGIAGGPYMWKWTIQADQWYCAAFSYNMNLKMARLQVFNATSPWQYSVWANLIDTCSTDPVTIGHSYGNSSFFKGAIDEIRVYDTDLLTNGYGPPIAPAGMFYNFCDTIPLTMQPITTAQLCRGGNISVGYNGGKLLSGNNIIVQLSNSFGSFASPTVIGSAATTTLPGFINCSIPMSTPLGSGYRIRVLSTNIADTTDDNGFNLLISDYPIVSATGTPTLCEGGTINLSVSSTPSNILKQWTGPLSFSSSLQNPTITNAPSTASGNYIVEANNNGCTTKDTVQVTVNPYPTPLAGSNGPICQGSTLNLTCVNAGSGVSYNWTGPASFTSNLQNPNISNAQLTANGDYVVTADINGCIRKDTVTVLVKLMPATPTVVTNSPLCSGYDLSLLAASTTAGVSYLWTGPLSYSSTNANSLITNTTTAHSGSYSVTASLNGCTSAAATTMITVNLTPVTPTAASNSPVCGGGVLNLVANTTMPGVGYSWTGPNGFASATQNPTISPAPLVAGGVYNVTAELNGCTSATASTTVIVNNVSSLGAYPSPNDTVCVNNANASFVAVPFNAGSAPQYQWFRNNSLIGGATNISYPATGIADGDSFYCRMTVTGLCADPLVLYSNKVGMTVLPVTTGPSVSITADPGTLLSPWQLVKFTAVATNAGAMPKYQWKRNGQDVIGAMSNVWSANNLSNGDTISCVVTSDTWCATPSNAASNRMVVNIKTGINDVDAGGRLTLYPNPNNGSFVVNIPLAPLKGGNLGVDVVDALGRCVYKSTIQPNQSTFEITLPASVANGVYLLKLNADGVVYHARFTVSR